MTVTHSSLTFWDIMCFLYLYPSRPAGKTVTNNPLGPVMLTLQRLECREYVDARAIVTWLILRVLFPGCFWVFSLPQCGPALGHPHRLSQHHVCHATLFLLGAVARLLKPCRRTAAEEASYFTCSTHCSHCVWEDHLKSHVSVELNERADRLAEEAPFVEEAVLLDYYPKRRSTREYWLSWSVALQYGVRTTRN